MRKEIELVVIRDLYREVEKTSPEGITFIDNILIKKNVKTPWMCTDIDLISDFEPEITLKGESSKTKSRLTYNGVSRTILMPYALLKKKLEELSGKQTKGIGYGVIKPGKS